MTQERGMYLIRENDPPWLYTESRARKAIMKSTAVPTEVPVRDPDLHPRVTTNLPISEVRYLGEWNSQNGESTCGVWATVNSIRAIGGTIDPLYVRDMLNVAVAGQGIAMNDTASMANGRDLDVAFTFIEPYDSLEHLPMIPYEEDPLGEGIIAKNAGIVAANVSESSALMVRIPGLVAGPIMAERRAHRVSVVGYRVDDHGYMDVQVIDSARGVFYQGIESLSRGLFETSAPALAVRKL